MKSRCSHVKSFLLTLEDEPITKFYPQAFNDYYTGEHNRLLSLWREVVAVKRFFSELQTCTERDLYRVKNDFDSSARDLLGMLSSYSINAYAAGQGVKVC